MNKINLEPGRKYRGSGWVNQYGEMFFRPEQKGAKPGNLHLVMEHETFSLYESARMWKVTVKFEKAGFSVLKATEKFLFIVGQIKAYMR